MYISETQRQQVYAVSSVTDNLRTAKLVANLENDQNEIWDIETSKRIYNDKSGCTSISVNPKWVLVLFCMFNFVISKLGFWTKPMYVIHALLSMLFEINHINKVSENIIKMCLESNYHQQVQNS